MSKQSIFKILKFVGSLSLSAVIIYFLFKKTLYSMTVLDNLKLTGIEKNSTIHSKYSLNEINKEIENDCTQDLITRSPSNLSGAILTDRSGSFTAKP